VEKKLKILRVGEIRTRFAPSPTGLLHLGGARTALFNFLFAKQHKGKFIIRIEDTDPLRSKKEYEDDILENLSFLGIEWDEGPDVGGEFGPYRQSERKEIYRKYLEKLLKEKKAYLCFCTPEELEAQKQYFFSIGKVPVYSGKCKNLDEKEREKLIEQGKKFVVRLVCPEKKLKFFDLIRGEIEFDTSLIGDFILSKGFENPLYNFTCAVDDYEMKITHVIRGEEHLSNTPKQILILEALNLPHPHYAHLPLILSPERTKLSKRHGAVSISEYRKMGYLPEALVNFLAFLGWNPGTEREFYSLNQLIKDFSLERVKKSPAIFYQKRLDYLNAFYIREKNPKKLTELSIPFLIESGLIFPEYKQEQFPPAYGGKEIILKYKISETKEEISFSLLEKIVSLYQTRIKKLADLPEAVEFFFKEKIFFDKKLLKWKDMEENEIKMALDKCEKIIDKIKEDEWNKEKIEEAFVKGCQQFLKEIKREGEDRGYLLWPLRVALTGKEGSAPPFEIMEILGKKKTLAKIKWAKEILNGKL